MGYDLNINCCNSATQNTAPLMKVIFVGILIGEGAR